jgi:hypothetical protein
MSAEHRYTPEQLQKIESILDSQLLVAAAVLLNGPTVSADKIGKAIDTVLELRDGIMEVLRSD